ncbi:5'-nucleotidase domain-containing protein [Butyrivibrio proteoclasticus B316]|uniref:5'-nucleotidase domain-containing protein n=1 Tax=Butyrivibrio proteoclasticus (strain ATCC 51982 / DSM 14932 / B316) TaxID=515622 RepID=E0RZX3_BUTPB|nr:bifunctional UDP-sugar hydrolase/5'-nucleotidase [Butyrivibrio proteoclasticus]ADL35539.1 5'-nucleotidase domain-containing protein [Butyrivibrio proteoclasticus B316]
MRIIFTSDTHGHLFPTNYAKNCPENSGLFLLASQIKKDENTLVLDGGDSLQGTPLLSYYLEHKDEYDFNPMAEGFNAMGLDYYTLGNHDFNFGYEAIEDYTRYMKATIISANVEDLDGKLGIQKNVIHTMPDGTRVGITAAVTGYVNVWEQPEHLEKLNVTDPVKALSEQYEELKDKCDLTIAIYHGGFEEDLETGALLSQSSENQACKICRELGYDILLTGHQHIAVAGTIIEGTYGVQPPSNAVKYCLLNVDKKDSSFDITSELVIPDAPDEKCREIIEAHSFMNGLTDKIQTWLDEPIGCLEKEIAPEAKLDAAIHGSKVAAIFNQVQLDYTGADFSCTSLANDPLGLKKEITVRDVLGIYQFANTVEVKEVTKAVLKAALERCAEYFDYNAETGEISVSEKFLKPKIEHYNYDYYAGLEYAYDLTRPVGERVVMLRKLDGTELRDDEKYTLVTSNYRATGTGGYECIGNCKSVGSYSDEMPDLLINFIRKNSPVKEIINGRFTVNNLTV